MCIWTDLLYICEYILVTFAGLAANSLVDFTVGFFILLIHRGDLAAPWGPVSELAA